MGKLTETLIAGLRPGEFAWDEDPPGFGIKALKADAKGELIRASFLFDYTLGGVRKRRVIATWPARKVVDVRKKARGLKNDVDDGFDPFADSDPCPTYEEAVKDYHRRYLVGERGATTADNIRDRLLRHGEAWKADRLDTLTGIKVQKLLDAVRDGVGDEDGRAGEANKLFSLLKTFFKWCARPTIGYLDASPLTDSTKPSDHDGAEPEPFTPEEIGAIWRGVAKLTRYERAYVRVLLLLPKRKRALQVMRHDEIAAGWWRMADAKLPESGARKLNMPMPLSAPVLHIIRGLPIAEDDAGVQNPYVFAGRHHGKPLDPGTVLQRKVADLSGVEGFYYHRCRDTAATRLKTIGVPGNAARRFQDHAQTNDAHEKSYTADELDEAVEDVADTWGRYVKLVVCRRVWARVSAFLEAADVAGDDMRRQVGRDRRREFYALLRAGGKPWGRWVRLQARRKEESVHGAARLRVVR